MCISKYMSLSFGLGVVHSHLRHFGDVIMAWIVLEPRPVVIVLYLRSELINFFFSSLTLSIIITLLLESHL